MLSIIQRILHMLPFMHFYSPWSSTEDCIGYAGEERQQRFCTVCNRKQYRSVNNFTYFT